MVGAGVLVLVVVLLASVLILVHPWFPLGGFGEAGLWVIAKEIWVATQEEGLVPKWPTLWVLSMKSVLDFSGSTGTGEVLSDSGQS